MFGQHMPPAAVEANVRKDGSFSLSGHMDGERHIIVFGKDKTPIRSIGADITAGKPNDLGVIDLSGHCPQ